MGKRQGLPALSVALAVLALFAATLYQSLKTYSGINDAEAIRAKYGPWAVVLGASEGLGAAWAEVLCDSGVNVMIAWRRQAALEQRAQEMSTACQVQPVVMDINNGEQVSKRLTDLLKSQDVGLVVYNAGSHVLGPLLTSLSSSI
ncbi:Inactive hydroxysteroid dehydrogenase-like protein 1 [Seminavis robusta]|uniref:Inactive hydroxysteroid dehydrogenase-like protein 1 n=1 Tax=Seminavis robusta TaxID=568900 RepID=A0A9N8EGN0_9STRA|nr:Inactive hydroxysteroid dehydrogenase-like protein 1 [Seminavis robusta]|eukprot:Sro1067_g237410.1 Inactive hydroxysteroid dehydrogenase-like protein 1 (145) ;mRNA; r:23542-23976